jgi:predicted secreted protein
MFLKFALTACFSVVIATAVASIARAEEADKADFDKMLAACNDGNLSAEERLEACKIAQALAESRQQNVEPKISEHLCETVGCK